MKSVLSVLVLFITAVLLFSSVESSKGNYTLFIYKVRKLRNLVDDLQIFNVSLNGDSTLSLHWMVDYPQKLLTFEIHLPSNFVWFAFGFSDRGETFLADYCLLWKPSLYEQLSLTVS